jgi:hypothetical protein
MCVDFSPAGGRDNYPRRASFKYSKFLSAREPIDSRRLIPIYLSRSAEYFSFLLTQTFPNQKSSYAFVKTALCICTESINPLPLFLNATSFAKVDSRFLTCKRSRFMRAPRSYL